MSANDASCALSVPDSFMPTMFGCSASRATASGVSVTPVTAGNLVQKDRNGRRVGERRVAG